jgi:hypothetical protein
MKTTKTILLAGIIALSSLSANAQLLLSNFSNYLGDAPTVDNGYGGAVTQNVGNISITSGSFSGYLLWYFDGTEVDYSAFSQVLMNASLTQSVSNSSVVTFMLLDSLADVFNPIATAVFTQAQLTGVDVAINLNILRPDDMDIVGGFQFNGDPSNSLTGTFDSLSLVNPVPEPSTYASLALGAVLLVWVVRRRQTCEI